jgi:hypothetical protein
MSAPKHISSSHLVISNLLRNVVGPVCRRTCVTWPYEERNYQLNQRMLAFTSSGERNGWRVMDNAVWSDWCLPFSDFRISRQKIAPLIKALFIYKHFKRQVNTTRYVFLTEILRPKLPLVTMLTLRVSTDTKTMFWCLFERIKDKLQRHFLFPIAYNFD